jgi:histidinol-phosphate aminotransferase
MTMHMDAAPDTAPRINPWIDAIAAYVPGKAKTADGKPAVKLSANENPFGPPPAAIEAMASALPHAHRYPDGSATALRTALASHYDLEPDRIICGAGSDEVLQFAATAFAGPGDEVLMTQFAFSIYPIAARRVGATPIVVPERDYTADVDALLAAVTPRTRMLFLANPNNPTGTVLPRGEIERLAVNLPPSVLFVHDSAYAEYLADDASYTDAVDLARTAPNVLVTRTFSKIHGLGGARVGWGYGPARVIQAMDKTRGPFNLTSDAMVGAIAALADTPHADRSRAHNLKWRAWLAQELAGLGNHGIRAVPSAANFIMLEFPETGPLTAQAAFHALMAQGYITRWLVPQGMYRNLRISIGTEEETRGVAAALRSFVEHAAA